MRISACSGREDVHPRRLGRQGQAADLTVRTAGCTHDGPHAVDLQPAAGQHHGVTAAYAGMHARPVRQLTQPAGRRPNVDLDLGRFGRGVEQHAVAGHVDDLTYLQRRRGYRLAGHEQPPGVVDVGQPYQLAAGQPGRYPVSHCKRRICFLGKDFGGHAGGRVDGQQPHLGLRTVLDGDQRAVLVPADGHQVLERVAVPHHLGRGTGQAHDVQRHLGIGPAGERVAQLSRWFPLGTRIGQVGDRQRGVVDPRDQQRRAVRCPPEPVLPVEGLCRDVLGQPVADVGPRVAASTTRSLPPSTSMRRREPSLT